MSGIGKVNALVDAWADTWLFYAHWLRGARSVRDEDVARALIQMGGIYE